MSRSYSELIKYDSFKDRLNYLMLRDNNVVSPRIMSQAFYKSTRWKRVRDIVIARDLGYDLGIVGEDIFTKIIVHHINPITDEDILSDSIKLYDLENLITVSVTTHNIIHYGSVYDEYIERKSGDHILW